MSFLEISATPSRFFALAICLNEPLVSRRLERLCFFNAISIGVGEDNSGASTLLGRDRDDAVEIKLPRKCMWVQSPNCREDLISSHGLGGMLFAFGAQEPFGRERYAEADGVGDCAHGLATDSG